MTGVYWIISSNQCNLLRLLKPRSLYFITFSVKQHQRRLTFQEFFFNCTNLSKFYNMSYCGALKFSIQCMRYSVCKDNIRLCIRLHFKLNLIVQTYYSHPKKKQDKLFRILSWFHQNYSFQKKKPEARNLKDKKKHQTIHWRLTLDPGYQKCIIQIYSKVISLYTKSIISATKVINLNEKCVIFCKHFINNL